VLRIFRSAIVILLIFWLLRQVGRPRGQPGKSMVRGWNRSHAKLTDWGLQQVMLPRNAVMLDVGCGGGRTVSRLSELAPAGRVVGLDVSAASVVVAQDTNAGGIEAGRVQILQGSVAALPFPSGVFDLVTAVETHYYWPDLAANVKEILRVLKPGGTFALIAEAYRGGPLR
jgi:SAM-dependent methyltransferase